MQRKSNELKAWGQQSSSDQGADALSPPDSGSGQLDAALVPVPKKKPPVPQDFNPVVAQQPVVTTPLPPPSPPKTSQPQSLFNVQGPPIQITPQSRSVGLPLGRR